MRAAQAQAVLLWAYAQLLTACGAEFIPVVGDGVAGSGGGTTTGVAGSGGGTTTGFAGSGGEGAYDTGGHGGMDTGGAGGEAPAGPKRVFVSSVALLGGQRPGLEGLDAFCNERAAAGTFAGTWRAWASTYEEGQSVNAIDRVGGDGPWILVNGIALFADREALLEGPSHPIDHTEFGSQITEEPTQVWTGTLASGMAIAGSECCEGWTSSAAGIGLAGLYNATGSSWTEAAPLNCFESARIYCFEQ